MKTVTTKEELRKHRSEMSGLVGFTPTMGYLHDGHMALVNAARAQNDYVVASIFVNPTQFGKGEDLDRYPRALERDQEMLEAAGVDLLFAPKAGEMYFDDALCFVEVEGLSDILIGALRPGHFRGVTTVVTKLFNLVQPSHAYFGEKDFQQLAILRQMVRDLDVPVQIEGIPIVREADGLAMSSRNVRLTIQHREEAVVLSQSLFSAKEILAKEEMTAQALEDRVRDQISQTPNADIKAVDVRNARTLEPLEGVISKEVVVLLSVKFGDVFLIDNMVMTPKT